MWAHAARTGGRRNIYSVREGLWDNAQPDSATGVQAALDYLRAEVPGSLLSARMHNSVAGSALHQGKPDLARAALDLMAAQRVARDARSWACAFRLLVRGAAPQSSSVYHDISLTHRLTLAALPFNNAAASLACAHSCGMLPPALAGRMS